MTIPSVDLNLYRSGNDNQKTAFVAELGSAFEQVGFVSVRNHGIGKSIIEDLYSKTKQFFLLPAESKKQYEITSLYGQRGYTSFGKEHAKGSLSPDLKEFFQYGQIHKGGQHYPDNVFVSEIHEFNLSFDQAFAAFESSGNLLLQAIAEFLHLPKNYFIPFTIHGNSILRAIHYPPIYTEPNTAIRAEQHEDINLITLLVGASADGLQILSKSEEWIPVVSLPDEIIVNVGDMLQRLTNDKLQSTTHRVVNPPKELWHTSRFSIPFFLHPISDMSLSCLDSCISSDRPKRYEDITAGLYLDERLKEIGLKK